MPNGPLPISKSFPTKTGYCHVFPDRIEIERSGWMGSLSGFLFGKGIHRIFGVYLFVMVLLVISLFVVLAIENYLLSIFFFGMIGFYGWSLWKSRDLSAAPVIYRNQIEKVGYHEAIKGVSRAYFTLFYAPKEGQTLRRLVMLPSTLKGGDRIAESAVWIMKEEGFLSND